MDLPTDAKHIITFLIDHPDFGLWLAREGILLRPTNNRAFRDFQGGLVVGDDLISTAD
ncbi:MAG: hypothetical protein NVS2B7_34620 [Herpetosiphon sp.]